VVRARALEDFPYMLAGYGPLSDGVPESLEGGEYQHTMPAAPLCSKPMCDADQTKRMRKARA
jgi:hypothetical protein